MEQPIILYLIALASLVLIVFSLIRLIRLKKCHKITGRVVDAVIESHAGSDGDATARYPVYEYEWQGKVCRYRSHASGNRPVGASVELYIDADGVIYEKRSALFLLLFGVLFLVVVLIQFAIS